MFSSSLLLSTSAYSQTIDFAVEVEDYFADLKVKIVDYFGDEKWEVVGTCSNIPNLKIEIVDYFGDKKVEIVDYFGDRRICITNANSLNVETLRKLRLID